MLYQRGMPLLQYLKLKVKKITMFAFVVVVVVLFSSFLFFFCFSVYLKGLCLRNFFLFFISQMLFNVGVLL
jgi:hypothetical protein